MLSPRVNMSNAKEHANNPTYMDGHVLGLHAYSPRFSSSSVFGGDERGHGTPITDPDFPLDQSTSLPKPTR